MMNGDVTCAAPSATAPVISVRRSNIDVKIGRVMKAPWRGLLSFLGA
jgi:hypothetical protein